MRYGWTDRWMDGPTDGRKDPLIEMQDASKNFAYIVKLPSFNEWVTHGPTGGRTDGPTDGRTDRMHLKSGKILA